MRMLPHQAVRSVVPAGGSAAGRIENIWGERTPHGTADAWPVREDSNVLDGVAEQDITWSQSACVLCSNGCGLDIGVSDGRIVGVRGRADDHVNHGRLGPKGLFAWKANHSADRLNHPLIRKNGKLQKATWPEAMNLIVTKARDLIKKETASTIGFYTSGQLFLE